VLDLNNFTSTHTLLLKFFMQKIYYFFYSILFVLLFTNCDLKNKESEPISVFTKIYDNANFDKAYFPTDIKQVGDSGFIILGHTPSTKSSFHSAYIMKIDSKGKFEWESSSDEIVNPVSELIPVGNDFKFICMGSVNTNPYLATVSKDLTQNLNLNSGLTYHLAASSLKDGSFLIETFDIKGGKSTQLSKINAGGSTSFTKSYEVFEDVSEKIFRNSIYQGIPVPFFVGEAANGNYFFNAYSNFTLTMIFTDGSGNQKSQVAGERYDGSAMTNALLLSNGKYATSNYIGTGENIFSVENSLIDSSVAKIKGNLLPEISRNARVIIKRATINSKNVVLYGTDTKNGQIVIFAYDETAGNLLGVKYLGSTNKFEMGGFTITKDGGLIVAGRSLVAGRFSRICVFKLSADDANALVAQSVK